MRAAAALIGVGAAVAVFSLASLPPARLALQRSFDDGTVAGAIHVHTNRSDGRSSPDAVAEAAARAGLTFLVFTDHGDAARPFDPPSYRSGVLCLDAVEISTAGGHYIAIGMEAAPYPLGGEARDVVEDVQRLGGFGVVAHPDSPKRELQWQEWDAPIDAVELVNPDTSWRLHLYEPGARPKLRLLQALFTYPVRPEETVANLLRDSTEALRRWDALTARRPIVALAGVDAHAKLELRAVDPVESGFSIPLPSYEATFGALSVRVRPARSLTGDAAHDAVAVLQGLRAGHVYSAADGFASPPAFEFTAANGAGRAHSGDELPDAGAVTLRVRSNAPDEFRVTIWRGSETLAADRPERELTVEAPAGPATYRVEIRAGDRPNRPAWIVSNPIYVRGRAALAPATSAAVLEERLLMDESTLPPWGLPRWAPEHDEASTAALEKTPAEFTLSYRLAPGDPAYQNAALRLLTYEGVLTGANAIAFTARADRPMRLSVQARGDDRWQRSIYLDRTPREYVLRFDDFRPVGATTIARPPVADLHSVMWVVDTVNTVPGASGRFSIADVRRVLLDAP